MNRLKKKYEMKKKLSTLGESHIKTNNGKKIRINI